MIKLNIHSCSVSNYAGDYRVHAFEQYRLFVETADRVSTRRQSTNSFFVAINTLLISLVGYASAAVNLGFFFYTVTSIAGILISFTWYLLILSYKQLNSAKFRVICAIENELPYRLYEAELDATKHVKGWESYLPFSSLEIRIPWIFIALHIWVFIYMALGLWF